MGKKIVIDTNNLISALGWEGNSRKLFLLVLDGEYELYISKKQINELLRVMDYPKFKFTESQKLKFLDILYSVANVIETKIELSVIKDKDDNMLLETAIECGANYIISGDKHLLHIKRYMDIEILSVKRFLS